MQALEGLTLVGAGGHGKVVADILADLGHEPAHVVDFGIAPLTEQVIARQLPNGTTYSRALLTIGDCVLRRFIASLISVREYPVVIHPSAWVSHNATVGEGTVVVHGAIVQSGAVIGRHCIVNTKASVGHDTHVEDFSHIASGATVCGYCTIGQGTWVGAGTVVKNRVSIGRGCLIGAGSVVVSDIPDGVVAYGNPCRPVRPI